MDEHTLEEIRKINERLDLIESRLPSVNIGGCPNCGGNAIAEFLDLVAYGVDSKRIYKCDFCHYKFTK